MAKATRKSSTRKTVPGRRKSTGRKAAGRTTKKAPPAGPGGEVPRLTLRQVRRAFRLVAQVRAHGADPARWRNYMIRRLAKLLEADMIVSSELSFLAPPHVRSVLESGSRELVKGATLRDRGFAAGGEGSSWQIDEEHTELRPQDYQVLLRPSVSPDGRLAVRPKQHLRAGQYFMLSQVSLPHADTVDQLGAYRFDRTRPFGPVEARLLRLVHTELGRLWRAEAMKRTRDPRADLAPRLAQTLTLLSGGASEKQVARELGISQHTVHNYVKALHQRFDVTSRGELLAKVQAAEKSGMFRPRLSVEIPRAQ